MDPEDKETDQPVKNPTITSGVRNILAILLLLIIIGAVGYFIVKSRSNKNNSQTSNTADQIRQSFNPPTSTSPTFNPPTPNSGFASGPSSSSSSPANQTANNSQAQSAGGTGAATPQTTPRTTSPSASLGTNSNTPISYRNSNLGFALTLPGNWVVDDKQNSNRVVFFDRNTGQIAGYIEVYNTDANNDLNTVAKTLQNSPSVSGISPVSVAGQPAVQYSASAGYTGGVAAVYNNRVYYLHGNLASPGVLSSFSFL
jgi:hypothetical protein